MPEERLAKVLGGATLSVAVVILCLILGIVFRPRSKTSTQSLNKTYTQPIFEQTTAPSPATTQSSASQSSRQPPQSSSTSGQKTYTVQAGDTLYGIAQKFKVDWHDLAEANGIEDATSLRVGQKLVIP